MHFRGQGYLHWELIDPQSGAVLPREKGVTGELVYTSVERDAMPLIRFRSRDNAEIIGTDAVGALKGARIRVLGRTDDMLICRGINVYPSAIQDIVNALRPVTSGRFRIAADFPGHSTDRPLVLRVECGETGTQPDTATTEVAAAVRSALGIRVEVLMVPPGTFPPPGAKKTPLIERDHGAAVCNQGDAVADESI
jgi:phenylacetate-CoA ligase